MNQSPESLDLELSDDARNESECLATEAASDDLRAKLAIRAYVESTGLVEPIKKLA